MPTDVRCEVPLTVRILGRPREDQWAQLEERLTTRYLEAIRAGLASVEARSRRAELAREPYDAARETTAGYRIVGYQDAQPTDVPVRDAGPGGTTLVPLEALQTAEQVIEAIRARFPTSGGRPVGSVYKGVYIVRNGQSAIHWLDAAGVLNVYRLFVGTGETGPILDLPGGRYTLQVRPHAMGQLHRGVRRVAKVVNHSNQDLTVEFDVDPRPGSVTKAPAPPAARFYPRVFLQRIGDDDRLTTGAEVTYYAQVEVWRAETDGHLVLLHPLVLVVIGVSHHWRMWRIEPTRNGGERRVPVTDFDTHGSLLRHTWQRDGIYEISCTVQLYDEEASPTPVSDLRRDTVVSLAERMAAKLSGYEVLQEEGDPDKPGAVWSRTPQELLGRFRDRLREEEARQPRNEALIRAIRKAMADAERQIVGQTTAGPYQIPAIFTDRRSGATQPITLFIGPAADPDPDAPHTWCVIDLTYPGSYGRYRGSGRTVDEAVRRAFMGSKRGFLAKYPPGTIRVHGDRPELAQLGIKKLEFDFPTESLERSAFEWLAVGSQVLGAIGLAAAIVFPPSAVITGALVIGAVAGATVSALNIAERIESNSFEWDAQAVTDVVNIAASLAFVGGGVARGVAGRASQGIRRGIAAGEPVSLRAATTLATALRWERAFLYTGLGADLTQAVVLSYDTYNQIREIDALVGPDVLAAYVAQFGPEEGRSRWEAERYTRVLGILARAALQGGLIAVSIRGSAAAAQQRAQFLRQPRIPGSGAPVSERIPSQTDTLPAFPEERFRADRRRFGADERRALSRRTGIALDQLERFSPQNAWKLNAALDLMSDQQRALLLEVMRPRGQDLRDIARFLSGGGDPRNLARFLESQPPLVRQSIGTFATLESRYLEFLDLTRSVPNLTSFQWDPARLQEHFNRHPLGGAGYPDEAWKWAQRLGMAEQEGLSRAAFDQLCSSSAPADVARRQELFSRYGAAYGDYVKTVLERSNVFARSGRGGDLVGSDGELIWFATDSGQITSGYFPDNPTARAPGSADDLQGIFMNAVRSGQSVILLFRKRL
jgi:hypothetical protein